MSEYYVDPKTGEKHKWVLATDTDFEKIELKNTPTIIPALHLPGIAQTPTILPSGMISGSDFDKQGGNYEYTGTAEYVEIPHRINGEILTSYDYMFSGSSSIKAVKSTNPNVTVMRGMFYFNNNLTTLDLTELDVSNVTNMDYMFRGSRNLTSIDITGWDTLKVKDMSFMFVGTANLTSVNLEWLRVGENTDISEIFNSSYRPDPSGLPQSYIDNNFNKTYTESDIVDTYEDTKEEPILYEQEVLLNDKLDAGIENVLVSEGIDGKRLINRSVIEYSNGVKHYDEIDRSVAVEPTNKVKETGTRIKDENFVLATDEDFELLYDWSDDHLKYIGPHKLVEIPHTINGEPVSMMPSFEGSGVMGIKYAGSGINEISMSFNDIGSPILDISRIDFSGVEMLMEPFGMEGANFTLLIASEIDFSHFGEWDMHGMFGVKADVLDLRGTKFPDNAMGIFGWEPDAINEILVLSEEEAQTIRALDTEGNLDNTTFTIQPFVEIVNEYEETVREPVPYEVIEIEDADLKEGESELHVNGREGLKEVTYLVSEYSDGSIEREQLYEEVLREPRSKEITIGINTIKESTEEVEETTIPFDTIRTLDNNRYTWEEDIVVQEGINGRITKTYEVNVYTNGEIERNLIDESRTEPVNKEISIGAKVGSNTDIVETVIPYKTETLKDEHLLEGKTRVVQSGKSGYHQKVYKLVRLDSGEIDRVLDYERTVQPVKRIVYIGIKPRQHWITEIYFMSPSEDRTYFVDKFRSDPLGISEQFGITLRERPNIPTAQMRYEVDDIQGVPGDHAVEDNYENVKITLSFNYISSKNARETYNAVSNYLATMKPGTRVRFSDDNDGTFRVLARRPSIEPLNNDLYNWGDFEIELTLKPFRYIEEEELSITTNASVSLKQPLPNAMNIPQRITHYTERNVNIETYKNGKKLYTINSSSSNKNRIITDAELLYTYGGD